MRSFSSLLSLAALVMSAAAAPIAPVAAQTLGSASADNFAGPLGADAVEGDIGAVAQTFVTPTGAPLLQSFTFYLTEWNSGSDLRLQGNVFLFALDHVVGPALYSSALRAGSSNAEGLDPLTFSGVNLLLTPGTMYALVLRVASASPVGPENLVGTTNGDTFASGQLFLSSGSSDAQLAAGGAFTHDPAFGSDAAVRVTFAEAAVTAPEPASLLLVASGLTGLAGFARRRRV